MKEGGSEFDFIAHTVFAFALSKNTFLGLFFAVAVVAISQYSRRGRFRCVDNRDDVGDDIVVVGVFGER